MSNFKNVDEGTEARRRDGLPMVFQRAILSEQLMLYDFGPRPGFVRKAPRL